VFGNPVPGHIQARSERWNRKGFIVTSTLAEHRISGRPLGTDFGNGSCGAPIYAMEAGRVSRWVEDTGALVIRIKHGNTGWSTGYAHMSLFTVQDGATVKRGQQIGVLGKSGATDCHLHADAQRFGVHADLWPLLEQNEVDESLTIVTYTPFPEGNRTWTAKGGPTTGYYPNGSTKAVNLKAGSTAPASGTAHIAQDPQKAPNGSGFVLIAEGALAGYYVLRTDGTVAPPTSPTYTQAQVDALVDQAEAQSGSTAATSVAAKAVEEAKKFVPK